MSKRTPGRSVGAKAVVHQWAEVGDRRDRAWTEGYRGEF